MRRMLDPKTIALIGATEARRHGRPNHHGEPDALGRADASSRSTRSTRPSSTSRASRTSARCPRPSTWLSWPRRPATVPDVLLAVREGGSARRHRRLGRLRRDRQGGPGARAAHQEDPARLPDARRRPQLPRHHPAERRAERVVPHRRAGARRHRAHLAERRAGHRNAGLGRERARRLLAVRLGRQHGRRRLRRPRGLPRRGSPHAQPSSSTWRASGTLGAS